MSTTYQTAVRPEFDSNSETYRVHHDPDSPWSVSTTVVLSIQSLTGAEPTEMRPLNRAVDPDILGSYLQEKGRDTCLSFTFHGHEVTVQEDGRLVFAPLEGV